MIVDQFLKLVLKASTHLGKTFEMSNLSSVDLQGKQTLFRGQIGGVKHHLTVQGLVRIHCACVGKKHRATKRNNKQL